MQKTPNNILSGVKLKLHTLLNVILFTDIVQTINAAFIIIFKEVVINDYCIPYFCGSKFFLWQQQQILVVV